MKLLTILTGICILSFNFNNTGFAQYKTKSDISSEAGIAVSKRIIIYKDSALVWFPGIIRMANGNLIANCQTTPDEINPDDQTTGYRFFSTDNGVNWHKCGSTRNGGPCKIVLHDGTYLELWFLTIRKGDRWVTKVTRSLDNGLSYSVQEDVPVFVDNIKEGAKHTGMVFDGGLLELDNGDMIATMYGFFQDDLKYRCILVRSSDKGSSWHYVSTIAYSDSVTGEGFCEPAMIHTKKGNLLVMLRTGSGKPMYQTLSTDSGKTWSNPVAVTDRGVEPDLIMTGDSTIVCSYGRPDIYVICSDDPESFHWTKPVQVFNEKNFIRREDSPYRSISTCYTTMAKICTNRILLIHDAIYITLPGDNRPYNYIFIEPLTISGKHIPDLKKE